MHRYNQLLFVKSKLCNSQDGDNDDDWLRIYSVLDSAQSLSHVQLFVTPWTLAHQAPLSIRFPRQEYWSGLPFFSRGSSWPRNWTHVSCIGKQVPALASGHHQGSPLDPAGSNPVSRITEDSLPAEPPGKTKNIGVGSLSLL